MISDETVSFPVDGQRVIGSLALPSGRAPAPVLLLLHGFTGHRDEEAVAGVSEGVFRRSARRWAERGLASLRIDFRGSGESEGSWEDTTFSGQITDALAAASWLGQDGRVDGTRLGLVGWSQGGLVAAAVARRLPRLRAVGLWAPVAIPALTFQAIFGAPTLLAGLAAGDALVTAKVAGAGETALRGGFFREIYQFDPVAEIAGYRGPLFVAAGTRDDLVAPQPQMSELFLATHDGPHELWVRDMDHSFDVSTGARVLDEMADATFAFMAPYLEG